MPTSSSPESLSPHERSASERIRRAVGELQAVESIFKDLASRKSPDHSSIAPELVLELKALVDQLRQVIRRYLEATAGAVAGAHDRLDDYRMRAIMQLLGLLHRPSDEDAPGTFFDHIEGLVNRRLHLVEKKRGAA